MRSITAACVFLFGALASANAQQTDSTTVPVPPPPVRAAGAYMNIGFDGLVDFGTSTARNVRALQRGDHDPAVKGFTVPNAEISLDGAVDPFFKGFANIAYKLDENGETGVELEEVYFITTALPHNLQVKAGQFLTEFGRQNGQHPHGWSFVDQPIVLNRMFGPDGLRSQGARVSWLAPTPWFTELMVTVQNSVGETAFSFRSEESPEIHGGGVVEDTDESLTDLMIVPRVSTSFDLSNTQTVVAGVSGAFGPNNSAVDARTSIFGADLYYKWKPEAAQQGFPFVSWQTEVLFRRYGASGETLHDNGWYSQLLWGIRPRIIAGLRFDHANGDEGSNESEIRTLRTRVSPNFTWYPTEFSKLRFQYNYDDRENIGTDHSFWMQFEFILGAHAAHKF
ncbi:MAG TPA: hypothetical protein VM100_05830 [Longimicrobiales bacterium]|nr:hypothetical protein [Longimicrobiales bacterium]